MKKLFIVFLLIFSVAYTNIPQVKQENLKSLFVKFNSLYNAGDLVKAEKVMLLALQSKKPLTDEQSYAANINLGAIYSLLGRYSEAMQYYSAAENAIKNNYDSASQLAKIYNNKAIIFFSQKLYSLGIEYYEKAVRIYKDLNSSEHDQLSSLSSAYLNLGVAFVETNDYKSAFDYLNKSSELKTKYKLSGLELVYLNLAKTYAKSGNSVKAADFYKKSVAGFISEHGDSYFRLAEVYSDYGQFLQSVGRNNEALNVQEKALSIYLKNYGMKHSLVSQSFKSLGDIYKLQSDYKTALSYYQKSLIAVVADFNDPDIFTNPSIDSSLYDYRLLDNLKSKSQALELFALQQKDPADELSMMRKSVETIELAVKLIDVIRNNYPSEESKIYLAENEKETYVFATHIAERFYTLSKSDSLAYKIYGIVQKSKSAILRHEITGNDILYSAAIPNLLREKLNGLSTNIAAYNKLISDELKKDEPVQAKISFWKDELFDMNRQKEKVIDSINVVFPQYSDLERRTNPDSVENIQRHLGDEETVVDYLLSNRYTEGKRKLYTFLIKKHSVDFRESDLDSLFLKNAQILRNTGSPELSSAGKKDYFTKYTSALNYMYLNLISPVETLFSGNKLIIIPDEEIGWLPFDAFLTSKPETEAADYEGLSYLINKYTISYGYSSSLLYASDNDKIKNKSEVISFSPSYSAASSGGVTAELGGAVNEINSVHRLFEGKIFAGEQATKSNFLKAIRSPAIFHLAMHSMPDSANSRYSYMLFDSHGGQQDSNRLYNYEISLGRLSSPMVVLSACNSGTGTLYSGEGLMSLARGFMLAGASSVIKTAWEVNDESSSRIITRFYYYLSKGKPKNEALRLAKLEFLKESPPAFTNPYYWAAYEVLGDNSPVAKNKATKELILLGLITVLSVGGLIIYFKRRRISAERSR